MKYPGQYQTENEIREQIKNLEEIASRGDMTVPQAQRLNHLRAELETIRIAKDTSERRWPILDK